MRFLLFIILINSSAFADRVLQFLPKHRLVALAQKDSSVWKLRDSVCLIRSEEITSCGTITRVTKKGIIVALTDVFEPIIKGDTVTTTIVESVIYTRSLSVGGAYPYHPYPNAHVQELITPNWSYGFLALPIRRTIGAGSIRGFALLLTLNWYWLPYKGIWLRAGVGPHIINIQGDNSAGNDDPARDGVTHLLFLATLGWRFPVGKVWTIGISAGGQYFPDPTSRKILSYSGFLPFAGMEVGITF